MLTKIKDRYYELYEEAVTRMLNKTDFGWMELYDEAEEFPISIFTEEEKNTLNLPIEGFWEILK